jgi:hypothetical protein
VYVIGFSQSGRSPQFLDGFNVDERERRVFDGLAALPAQDRARSTSFALPGYCPSRHAIPYADLGSDANGRRDGSGRLSR